MGNRFSTTVLQRLGAYFSARILSLATVAVAAAFLPCLAGAGTIPTLLAPSWSVLLQTDATGSNPNAPGEYALGGVSVTASPGPLSPLLSVQVCCGGVPSDFQGVAQLIYQFAVTGDEDGLTVPLHVDVTMHASASGPDNRIDGASASIRVDTPVDQVGKNVAACAQCGPPPPGTITDFSGTLSYNGITGRAAAITMGASAGTVGGGFAAAFIDPFIFIDALWLLDHPGYSVIVSAGIFNEAAAGPAVPGVPEPASLVLFVSGLLGFVALRRRRS